jgi:3-hydroxyisobutyrate dehydrogenase-like beta-hydroxyacid dehydrogenase
MNKIVRQLIFVAVFVLLQEAMPIAEMFNLNLEAILKLLNVLQLKATNAI